MLDHKPFSNQQRTMSFNYVTVNHHIGKTGGLLRRTSAEEIAPLAHRLENEFFSYLTLMKKNKFETLVITQERHTRHFPK